MQFSLGRHSVRQAAIYEACELARLLEHELNLRTQQLAKAVEEVLRQKQKWTDERVRRRLCNAGPLEMEYLQDRIDECDDTLAAVEALEPKDQP